MLFLSILCLVMSFDKDKLLNYRFAIIKLVSLFRTE